VGPEREWFVGDRGSEWRLSKKTLERKNTQDPTLKEN
jgi:hypothetical protein